MNISGMADWETMLDLPLRSIGDQVRRVESHLREIDVVATGMPVGGLPKDALNAVATRLEAIRRTLESIEGLILNVESQVTPSHQSGPESDDHREYVRRTKSRHVDD
jgi:hypothetical protein